MQRVIVDTNVLVSSLIQKSYPYQIIYDLLIEEKFVMCVSDPLVQEYHDVLSRPKFVRFPDFSERSKSLLADIHAKAKSFSPSVQLDIIVDQSDNMILELAEECRADFIITGNTRDFTFAKYKQTKIVSPKNYWVHYAPK